MHRASEAARPLRTSVGWRGCVLVACLAACSVSARGEPAENASGIAGHQAPAARDGEALGTLAPAPAPSAASNGLDPEPAPMEPSYDSPTERAEPPPRYPYHDPLPGPERLANAPARRYSTLSPGQCRAELRRRGLPARPAGGAAPGVATPLRLDGRFGDVRFITPGARSVYGMLDCRLVLTLAEFAAVLERHGVREVHVDNFYRPRARLPGRKSKRSQHAYGLAIDIRAFGLEDGRVLLIERDWLGAAHTPPCGPESEALVGAEDAVRLRNLVCDAAREGVFHHLLTPNYDAAHRDHLHLDIKRDARAIVVR